MLELHSGRDPEAKYTSLAIVKFLGGLQSQRSAFASIDTRYNTRFLGGKPDALAAGNNCEISNKLTLQRRPGLLAFGVTSIPSPQFFFDWQLTTTGDIVLVIDTKSSVYNYSPTDAGIIFTKATNANQTSFYDLVNTLYMGNGADLFKDIGPNLLSQSNTFGSGAGTLLAMTSPWISGQVFSLTPGQADPLGGTTATQVIWNVSGPTAFIEQDITPNYTPIASNTFTFSIWLDRGFAAAHDITLSIKDQNGVIASKIVHVPSLPWTKFQVTGTMNANSNIIKCVLGSPNAAATTNIYGAQLEIGGPATTTQITVANPQGVYLWGIAAPTVKPSLAFASQTGSTGKSWQPSTNYNVGDTIVDSNGNFQYAYDVSNSVAPLSQVVGTPAGKSGTIQPTWNLQVGGTTQDGLQNTLIQHQASGSSSGASGGVGVITITLPNNVTASNSLLVGLTGLGGASVAVTDNQGNTYTKLSQVFVGSLFLWAFFVRSAAAGSTTVTITVTGGGQNVFLYATIAEIAHNLGIDGSATSNSSINQSSGLFATGGLTTSNAKDIIYTMAVFDAYGNGTSALNELGNLPLGFTPISFDSGFVARGNGHGNTNKLNMGMGFEAVSIQGFANPQWTISNPTSSSYALGITAAFKTDFGTLGWLNQGKKASGLSAGLTATIGYQYYYAYQNSQTGHLSNVSPISATTGVITGQQVTITVTGMPNVNSGDANHDPQVDKIVLFRNTDGGSFWYQLAVIPNQSAGLTTTYVDTIQDADLNTAIFAPIALLNSVPPAGLANLEFFAGRLWGSVNNLLYYTTAADNAALLNIKQNGVAAESWSPANVIPFNSPITRSIATGGGLIVFTTTDTWIVVGQNLLTGGFNPIKLFAGVGLRSYNALCVDGSTLFMYTSDHQALMINPNSGAIEAAFPIGDTLETTFNPTTVYLARHVSGSQDNAFYIADGSTGWFRLNPNQVGASMGGEQTLVWSPKANITGGCGAIGSIETTAGTHKLLVGQTGTGVVLVRDINTFSDNGTTYTWSATIGSIMLTSPGKLAEVDSITTELNNSTLSATQPGVGVLLDEISGNFESLPNSVSDPPQLPTISSVVSNRFYLAQVVAQTSSVQPPVARHLQIQLTGANAATRDELLALTVRGALVPETV